MGRRDGEGEGGGGEEGGVFAAAFDSGFDRRGLDDRSGDPLGGIGCEDIVANSNSRSDGRSDSNSNSNGRSEEWDAWRTSGASSRQVNDA